MFGTNSYAKIKEVVETGENYTVCKISIARKNQTTNAYEPTFVGNVKFCGKAHLQRPMAGQRIKLTSCGVNNCYTKNNKLEFLKSPRYIVFGYELQGEQATEQPASKLYTMEDDDGLIPF